MVNILHNRPTIDESWCLEAFSKYINKGSKVLVIALSFRDVQVSNIHQWEALYAKGKGIYYNGTVQPFAPYGIDESKIQWINYYTDTPDLAKRKIKEADILYFTGGAPDQMYERIMRLNILDAIKNHQGVVMGFSAGAMIQLSEYHISPDEDYPCYCYGKGCGLLHDFGIEVHYEKSDEIQNMSIRRFISEKKKPVYAIADDGALIVSNGQTCTIGNVYFYGANNLPCLDTETAQTMEAN